MNNQDINNMRQNHPALVVRDLESYCDAEVVKKVLLMRGINKWLYVRRLLIQLKHRWKDRIDSLESEAQAAKERKDYRKYLKLKGRRAELIECRQQIRALCHSPREVDWEGKHIRDMILPEDFPQMPHKRWFCKR